MKTVLDLIGEYARLNDAKIRRGGHLVPSSEKRWEELKSFYDLLMSHTSLAGGSVNRWSSAIDVLIKVDARERLRVPVEREFPFEVDGELHKGFAVNISLGGIYVASSHRAPAGKRVSLYLAQNDARGQAPVETRGVVVWVSDRGVADAFLPPGMGIRFTDKRDTVEDLLDGMVVDALVRHLSGLDVHSLAPDIFLTQQVEL
ncbi:MAG TPA: PilZ domain-containing protein [Vicinamibacteria bacterium]|nr:PilZ domain-containing protein [Vicinamibacteria bacterium]